MGYLSLFIILLASISFYFSHIFNTLSLCIRISDESISGAFVSHSRESMFRFISGYLGVFFTFLVSFSFESGLNVREFLFLFFISSILMLVSLFYIYNNPLFGSYFFIKIKNILSKHKFSLPVENEYSNEYFDIHNKLMFISSISFFLLYTGYLFSFILAYLFPDYRLTIFQLASLIHGAGTFFLVFGLNRIVARMMSLSCEENPVQSLIRSIIAGQILSVFIVIILIVVLLVISVVF